MTAIFRLQNIPLSVRVVILSGVFVVPLAILAYFHITQNTDSAAFASAERAGVAYLRELQPALLRATSVSSQNASNAASGSLHDANALRLGLGDQAADIDAALATSRGQGPSSALAAKLADLTGAMSDKSNLSLDPDMDSYYLQDALINQLGALIQDARLLHEIAVKGGEPATSQIERTAAWSKFETAADSFAAEMKKAAAADQSGDIAQQLGALQNAVSGASAKLLAASKTADAQAIDASADELHAAAADFMAHGDDVLDALLAARISGIDTSLALEMIVVLALVLCGGLFAFLTARSIVVPTREMQEKLEGISRSQGVIEYKLDGTIISANQNFLSLMGYKLTDIEGRHHSIFADPEYAKSNEYRSFWERLGRGEFISQEYKRKGAGGKDIWIQANYNPLLDLKGKPYKVVNYMIDMTAVEQERESKAAEQARVVRSLASGLKKLSDGDLTVRIDETFAGEYDELRLDYNAALTRLQDTMKSVEDGAGVISTGAAEISQASDDLARRTEQQASSLEETAAALEEITATVKKTAVNAKEASKLVAVAKNAAEEGGNVVETAIRAMGEIEQSSKQITDIIGVIDEIAFQTNLLALNAGVEAARAGDAGKGFAVVASEVRALAQRSSEAAKEIKTLIKASGEHVSSGVKFVGESGQALKRIVSDVTQINSLVTEMAQAAQQQSTGIEEVNVAVGQMDQVTQQNAAMVEQSTAASRNLATETQSLSSLVGFFAVGGEPKAPPQAAVAAVQSKPQSRVAPTAMRRPMAVKRAAAGGAKHSGADGEAEDWTEF